jgi:hypothetical protein
MTTIQQNVATTKNTSQMSHLKNRILQAYFFAVATARAPVNPEKRARESGFKNCLFRLF